MTTINMAEYLPWLLGLIPLLMLVAVFIVPNRWWHQDLFPRRASPPPPDPFKQLLDQLGEEPLFQVPPSTPQPLPKLLPYLTISTPQPVTGIPMTTDKRKPRQLSDGNNRIPGSASEELDRTPGIARLVAAGNMTHEKAGQYTAEHVTKRARGTIPNYNRVQVRTELPNILEIQFDEDDDGCFALMRDGSTGEDVRVPLGDDPPVDTDALIACIQAHYRDSLNTDALNETAGLFAAIDESE